MIRSPHASALTLMGPQGDDDDQRKLLLVIAGAAVAAMVLVGLVAGSKRRRSGAATGRDDKVYITANGSCYHRRDCPQLSGDARAVTLAEAKEDGLRPCSVCEP